MGHQPEYRQSHSHEQIEPVPSFGWEKEGQIAFHRFACRNLSNPERLISHALTPPQKKFFRCFFTIFQQIAYFISRFFIMIIPIQVNSTPYITKIAATTENHSATVITCTLWNIATGQYIEIT